MKGILNNKWVLIGGASVLGIVAFMYMRGGASSSEDDSGATGFSVPFMYGGYAPTGAGLSGDGAGSSVDTATSMLLQLENKKADYQKELGLAQLTNEKEIAFKGYDTQKDIAFRQYQSQDFESATNLLSNTIGKAKGKKIPGILASGVGLTMNMGGVTSSIAFGSGANNPTRNAPPTLTNPLAS